MDKLAKEIKAYAQKYDNAESRIKRAQKKYLRLLEQRERVYDIVTSGQRTNKDIRHLYDTYKKEEKYLTLLKKALETWEKDNQYMQNQIHKASLPRRLQSLLDHYFFTLETKIMEVKLFLDYLLEMDDDEKKHIKKGMGSIFSNEVSPHFTLAFTTLKSDIVKEETLELNLGELDKLRKEINTEIKSLLTDQKSNAQLLNAAQLAVVVSLVLAFGGTPYAFIFGAIGYITTRKGSLRKITAKKTG